MPSLSKCPFTEEELLKAGEKSGIDKNVLDAFNIKATACKYDGLKASLFDLIITSDCEQKPEEYQGYIFGIIDAWQVIEKELESEGKKK